MSRRSPESSRASRLQRAAGAKWFRDLPRYAKERLGDELVLGTFDWIDWCLERKPSRAFLDGADAERIRWETMQ